MGRGHGEQLDCETMWCPSATLSVWANAWLAGKAAPDDVLDALSCWAPSHSVTAYDAVAAGHTGLPWPDINDAGAVSLLQTLRTAAGRAVAGTPSIRVALPVPGDVRGLAPGTQFERDALAAGEAVIVTHPDDPSLAVGLVPEYGYDESDDELVIPELCSLSWTVYSLPSSPVIDHIEGWRRAMSAAGLDTEGRLIDAPFDRYGARAVAVELLRSPDRPPAIFCSTDDQAIGVARAAREVGVRIPEDLALAGFDDIPEAAFCDPPLTTIASDRDAMAKAAVDLVLDDSLLVPGSDTPRVRRFPSRLVTRRSCGCG